MAVGDKLQTVASGVTDIRTVLNTFNSSLGNGHISTLDDNIRAITNATIVLKSNPYETKFVLNNGTTMAVLNEIANIDKVIIPQVITSIPANALKNSTVSNVTCSNNITSIGNYAFQNCSNFKGELIFDSPVNLGISAFYSCNISKLVFRQMPSKFGANWGYLTNNLQELIFESNDTVNSVNIHGLGNESSDSVFRANGNVTKTNANSNYLGKFRRYYIGGNLTQPYSGPIFGHRNNREIHIAGNINCTNASAAILANIANTKLKFVEVGGVINNAGAIIGNNTSASCVNGFIWHFAKTDGIACSPTIASVSNSRVSKVYVGDGSSQEADQAVLNMYLADTDWAQYTSKLDLWYNYTGEFKQ